MQTFTKIRSAMYLQALREYPGSRFQDIEMMKKYLSPKVGETILEVGAGGGLFTPFITKLIEESGKVFVTDESEDQLQNICETHNCKPIHVSAENLPEKVLKNSVDKIWSCGALHHMFPKKDVFESFGKVLISGGKLIIADVFGGSTLAKHFDSYVARYCITGHEVSFLTREFARSLCYLTGFQDPVFEDVNLQWKFNSEPEVADFLYKIHAMLLTTKEKCLIGAKELLGIEQKNKYYWLNWPLTVMIAEKK